jgi:polyhydroxyalkanoate synthesis regulator protein
MLRVGLEKRRTMTEDGTPPIVNRYAGQRLYDPAAGAFLTLDDLAQRVEDDDASVAAKAKTGDAITRSVLQQIIVERKHHD